MRWLLLLLLSFSLPLHADDSPSIEVIVDLRNPTYQNGILYTNQGGVIKNQDIRIQARNIHYIRRTEDNQQVHQIEAEGDLMIQYKGRVYVGTELNYDFIKKRGTITNGKTFSSMWYIGGDEIELNPDGSYKVKNAFITTCENRDSSWDLHASSIHMAKGDLFEAKKIRLRFFKIPTLWLPSFKINLRKFKEPIFRYTLSWQNGRPLAGIRYQLYSWRDFALYGRVEYRWRTGWGGALETEYFPPDKRTTFVTRNYLGKNLLENAPPPALRRYRVQGAFFSMSESGKTNTMLTWDKYSDVRMPNDFKSEDFEVNTSKRTIFYVRHQEEDLIAALKVRPRANPFESIQQDLPTLFTSIRPIEIGPTGIISSHYLKTSYVDFDYSDQLVKSLQDYQSIRLELREMFYRPFHMGPFILTPHLGGTALFYSTSPSHQAKGVGFLSYGAKGYFHGQRTYSHYKHILEPYLQYTALTRPTVTPDNHYIFSIQDGYNKIQEVRLGFRNLLFSKKRPCKEASFTADLYANAFFAEAQIPQVFPRMYLLLNWKIPSVDFTFFNCWNFRHQTVDFSNALFKWTYNENLALNLEGRYRSRFDWRKGDHDNFILDVTRSETELLLSPLSDRRITFLTNLFFRPSPFWECQIQSHHGFFRLDEDPYNEVKVHLYTWISAAWKLRLTYGYTAKVGSDFGIGISLIKK
ncbi:MAG TPA: hypothetical protein VLE89_08770 [Chlamydiales bacterium]|nr:hypothetical protein [Chlamydiales bacterium]